MSTDIFPHAGYVQDAGQWVQCKHPKEDRRAVGGGLDVPFVVCLACGVYDSITFHGEIGSPPVSEQGG